MQTPRFLAPFLGMAALCFCNFAFAEESLTEGDDVPPPAVSSLDPANAPLRQPWYRDSGEFLSSRSVRKTVPADVNSKIITDAKRFDVSVGKRIPLISWNEVDRYEGWTFGVDGGMLASLIRYNNQGRLTFATNTFDGMFGIFLGYINGDGWLAMLRGAHLSAHLVDNSPLFQTPIAYSQFWTEVILGKSFPETRLPSHWDLHLQGSVGLNSTSIPRSKQPRASLGTEFGYAFHGADSLGLIASADALRAGVEGQDNTYAFFLGMGYLSRPQTTHRPFRVGVAHFIGSDYRNQLYFNRQNWTTFEVATEF